jgi:effector-binding domain-containing protein
MEDPRIVALEARPTIAVRLAEPAAQADMGALFARELPRLATHLMASGGAFGGAPFGRYHAWGETIDVEIGIPVATPIGGQPALDEIAAGEIGASELPGGPAAVAIHRGPYDSLPSTHDALRAWIASQGRIPGAACWESYIDDPGAVTDPTQLRTEVVYPLAG